MFVYLCIGCAFCHTGNLCDTCHMSCQNMPSAALAPSVDTIRQHAEEKLGFTLCLWQIQVFCALHEHTADVVVTSSLDPC
jgi:hypothetical protein